METVTIRAGKIIDIPFIFATALKAMWYDRNNKTKLSKKVWMKTKHVEIEKALNEKTTYVAVVDDEFIVGYVIQTNPIFFYVRPTLRGIGIEDALQGAIQ